jgi:BirA family biotin operon repressor/biotin-[acetyl-CoA-carboxylase] ligase
LSPKLDYVVVGIGINLTQSNEVFARQGLGQIATSLRMEGYTVETEELTRSVLQELERMYGAFPRDKEQYLAQYRAHCLTLGRQVCFVQDGVQRNGTAQEIDDQFGLTVFCGATKYTVTSGTVQMMEEQV